LAKWAKKWTGRFDRMSLSLAKKFTGRAFQATEFSMRAAFKRAGFVVEFKPTRASLQAYRAVAAENVGLIKSIPTEYLTDVQAKVWESVKSGADMSTLSQGLRETYDVTTKRAALIARDQNNKAKAVIENTRRQQLGIKQAIWQHSHAGKVPRPTHVRMNGKTFDLDKGMYDSHEKKYVWPGQLINCRCTSRAIIPVGT
jgi:SPP1 gp7 family putative phage head morphogenesis protein